MATSDQPRCQACGSRVVDTLYRCANVPVHSVQRIHTREAALQFPTGDIVLGHCADCGFIHNTAFDPDQIDYATDYESTQIHSPTFCSFQERLARTLVQRYGLQGKRIVEIGCGQGEFLRLLCRRGDNRGWGYDPAYRGEPAECPGDLPVHFIREEYEPTRARPSVDFICCRMTLEHIFDVRHFVGAIRASVGAADRPVLFIQVPNAERILREHAFWDIYYEHCSYFTSSSLCQLVERCGFDVREVQAEFDDQYLTLAATPSANHERPDRCPTPHTVDAVSFGSRCEHAIQYWRTTLASWHRQGQRTVLWGGGSKAVAFCTTLKLQQEVACVVDVNPRKQGTYLPGQGQQIVPPTFLRECTPHHVVLLNPVYRDEVAAQLNELGVSARLDPVHLAEAVAL